MKYGLIFYSNFADFLDGKLKSFFENVKGSMYFYNGEDSQEVENFHNILVPHVYGHPNNFWCIHGALRENDCALLDKYKHTLCQSKTIEQIVRLYEALAYIFEWAIFPAGGYIPYIIFGFVSQNTSYIKLFKESHPLKVSLPFTEEKKDLFISDYTINTDTPIPFKGIVYHELKACELVWKHLTPKKTLPIIATMDMHKVEKILHGNDLSMLAKAKYEYVNEYNISYDNESEHYKLYKPLDYSSLLILANLFYGKRYDFDSTDYPVIIISANSDLCNIKGVLEIMTIEAFNQDLCVTRMSEILSMVDWICVPSPPLNEDDYILFLSNHSDLINKLRQCHEDSNYICCF
jgi:hypothetical protein